MDLLNDDVEAPIYLQEVPEDAILQIGQNLDVQEVLNLATTCRKLSEVLNKDEIWRRHVESWIARQDPRSNIQGISAAQLQSMLGLHSLRPTCQALLSLKSWPEGLWHSHDTPWAPRGVLLWVSRSASRNSACGFHMSFIFATLPFDMPPWPQNIIRWRVRAAACSLELQSDPAKFCSERSFFEMRQSEWGPEVQMKLHADAHCLQLAWSTAAQTTTFNIQPGRWLTFHRAGIRPTPIPMPTWAQQVPSFCPTPGLYAAVYGPHGVEALQVEIVGPDSPGPPNCPIQDVRLQALKIIGDPNVPASKYSFAVSLTQGVIQGPYDPSSHDPFPGTNGPRPVVSFEAQQGMPAIIDLTQRPVVGLFANAVGQINRLPGEWQPEFVAATVVVYGHETSTNKQLAESEGALRGGPASFGVIFEDEGFEFRHIMDFYPLPDPSSNPSQEAQHPL